MARAKPKAGTQDGWRVPLWAPVALSLALTLFAGYLLGDSRLYGKAHGAGTNVAVVRNDTGKNAGDPYLQVHYRFDVEGTTHTGVDRHYLPGGSREQQLQNLRRQAAAFPAGMTLEVEYLLFAPAFNRLADSPASNALLMMGRLLMVWAAGCVVFVLALGASRAGKQLARKAR